MTRKKRQGDPNQGNSSSDSCDENQNTAECPHINKSVDLQKVRRVILKTSNNGESVGFATECEACKKNPTNNTNETEMNGDYECDRSLWMCLKCGNQACGRFSNQHALQHYKTPHSDSHAMCVNTTTWMVWCYECDEEVNLTSATKKLQATLENLMKLAEKNKKKQPQTDTSTLNDRIVDVVDIVADASSPMDVSSSGLSAVLPSVRGLSNLGNTCFFNSVMQCLGQTPYLLSLLEETSQPGQTFRLPGGKFQLDKDKTIELEPLEGVLDEWRPLTRVLAETLQELQSGSREVYVPRMLLSRLTQRMPQFGGGQQQDSHELLRHLLEAVREEDLRRYQTVILDKLGLSKKTDPSSVEGEKKKIIRFYGQQASEFLLPTEQVFRGVLLSRLQCQECEHTSHREEFFLDLSLPITEKQIPPALRRKAAEIEDNSKPSQYQSKKEKRAEKKKKKSTAKGFQLVAKNMDGGATSKHSESESDADVEDNVEEKSTNSAKKYQATAGGSESGYNSDKANNGSSPTTELLLQHDENKTTMCVDDSGVPSPAVGMLSVSPDSPETSYASADINIDMGSPICGRNSPNDEEIGGDRPESRLSFVKPNQGADLKADFSRLSLLNDSDKRLDLDDSMEGGAYGGCDDEEMEESCDNDDMWMKTMSTRYICTKDECSVQSCLNQFTAPELLTGNNKVGCELCTKRHGGPEKKTVYTNAIKQLLIYNPPAVLILHLKRFQVLRFRSTKVNKPVSFPTLLDLAPFCSRKSRDLPTFDASQNRVLYSLYGVVEHSGSIHGGHYVAFVKVRPRLDRSSQRWQFLPKNQAKSGTAAAAAAAADVCEPPGKWYYVSDSYVSEVTEKKVLNAQAYLLFYERIL